MVPKRFSSILPYIADLGVVIFMSTALLALIAVVAEFFSPGIAANYLSPQMLLACAAVSGALSLLDGARRPPGVRSRTVFFAAGTIIAVSSYKLTAYYFASMPHVAVRLALLTAFTVAAMFILFGRRAGDN